MSSNSLVLKESEINLLKFSNYIKNTESKEIIDIIFSNKKVLPKQYNPVLEKTILEKKNEWLAISSNEWRLRKSNPIITNPSDDRKKWKRCSLCNTPNKLEFYIVNKHNGNVINIGGNCSTNVITGEMNELSKLIKSERAGKRYVKILSKFPELRQIIFTPKKFLYNLEYEVPTNLEKEYIKKANIVKKYLKKFLNSKGTGDNFKTKLVDNLNDLKETKSKINTFETKASSNNWYLSKTIKITFQTQPNAKDIISEIKDNGSKIDKNLAKKITAASFLNKYIKTNFNRNNKSLPIKIKNCLDNKIIFDYTNEFNSTYSFEVDSKIFINSFGNIIFETSAFNKGQLIKFFIENADLISPHDKFTKDNLITYLKYSITDSNTYFPYDLYTGFSKNLNEWYHQKFESIINNINVYRKPNEQLLYVFRNERSFISVAIIMLFQNIDIQEKTLFNFMNTAERISANSLFNELKTEVYKEKIT